MRRFLKRFSAPNIVFIFFSIAQTWANLKVYSNEWAIFYKLLGAASIIFILAYNPENKKTIETAVALFIFHSFKIFDKSLVFWDFLFVHGLSFFMLVYILCETYKEKASPPKKDIFNLSLLIFACLGLISTVTSPCLYNALQQYLVLLDFLIFAFIVANYFKEERQIRLAVNLFFVTGAALIALAAYNLKLNSHIERMFLSRLRASEIHPNSIAGYLNIVTLLSVPLFLKIKRLALRTVHFLLLVIFVVFSLSTFSRLGIFSLMFCLALFLLVTWKRQKEYSYERRSVLLLIISSFAIFIAPAVNQTLVNRIFSADSNNANFYNCLVSVESLRHRPFFGFGFDSYYCLARFGDIMFLHSENYSLSLDQTRVLLNCAPHSLLLGIMQGLGVFGFTAFALIVFIAMKSAVDIFVKRADDYLKRVALGCFLAIASILIHGIMAMVFHFTVWPAAFWIMVGIIMAISNGEIKTVSIKINRQFLGIAGLFALIAAVLIVIAPLLGEHYYERSVWDRQTGGFKKALQDIGKARVFCCINPKYAEFLRDIYMEIGMKREAIKISKDLVKLKRFYAPYHVMLGDLYWDSGQRPQAIEEFKNAIVLDKLGAQGGEHYSKLGISYINLGMREEAAAVYKEGIILSPDLKSSRLARELNI